MSAAAAQDTTEAVSSRFAPAIPHAGLTDFAQLSSDAQPRPTSKTLATRLSQPVLNATGIHYGPFPENDDPDTCPSFSHDVFTSGDIGAEITRLQDEVALGRHG